MTTKELAECQRDTIHELQRLREDWQRVEGDVVELRERTAAMEARCGILHAEKRGAKKGDKDGDLEAREMQVVGRFALRHWKVLLAGVALAYSLGQAIVNKEHAAENKKQLQDLIDFVTQP